MIRIHPFAGLLSLLVFILAGSCVRDNSYEVDLSGVPPEDVHIKRYEQAMFTIPADSFLLRVPLYRKEFPLFLGGDIHDTNALLQLKAFFTDPYMQELYRAVNTLYPDLKPQEEQLADAFRHLHYYLPRVPTPTVYSYVSGLDFRYPVKYVDNNLLIALDMYLGPNTKAYKTSGFPRYLSRWFIPEAVVPDVCREMATGLIPPLPKSSNMLQRMVYEGKKCYLTRLMMPHLPDTLLFEYSAEKMQWASKYQGKIWAFIIDNQLLYSKDKGSLKKFFDDAPFTDLFSKSSPAHLGTFIGYHLIEAFMHENDISLEQMLMMDDAQQILQMSRYKPHL